MECTISRLNWSGRTLQGIALPGSGSASRSSRSEMGCSDFEEFGLDTDDTGDVMMSGEVSSHPGPVLTLSEH